MATRLENYAFIGDLRTAAVVSRDGSVDWWSVPRFDSQACFSALVGSGKDGRWSLAPAWNGHATEWRYRDDSLVMETVFEVAAGRVRVTDAMPLGCEQPTILRVVSGLAGRVTMRTECRPRFYYGRLNGWKRGHGRELFAVGGPDAVVLRSSIELRWDDDGATGEFTVAEGETVTFALSWYPSHQEPPRPLDAAGEIERCDAWWRAWAERCVYEGPWREAVVRSAITLKALTYAQTGAIVAAVTSGLPEQIGGDKNWDYRFCWLRDSSFTAIALLNLGYVDEARALLAWFFRMCADDPAKLQIMYQVTGERRLVDEKLAWLSGYEGSQPVRRGNAAATQFQLGVYGQVITAFESAQRHGVDIDRDAWDTVCKLLEFIEESWRKPGAGFWESRAGGREYTDSKVMCWAAFDRALRLAENVPFEAPREHWEQMRARIGRQVLTNGFDVDRNSFTQHYGSQELDATALLFPAFGLLPYDDPRMRVTVNALESELIHGGFLYRYSKDVTEDGSVGTPAEGAFIACNFWLASYYALAGRRSDAERLFEKLLAIRGGVGLLSEEYDTKDRRLLGNLPQALSHVGLIQTAVVLARNHSPLETAAAAEA
ncbi:MAG: glycoside hydrolase family 15 protein [Candidatus Eremiobacteraeota bacterium]|nr:glycoside hydrolase family 15 protein [Candidatus Eremiobacteraeota bacterium]MBC5801792.1 glycoside hydrolase family 15 protein [Candidatus Eremiobacteraeota bacterium]MBC5823142.1 glycoside hydrolase family 15 protein [Candidatus Eremiobacteraeota bacterium]